MKELAIVTSSFFIALAVAVCLYLCEWTKRKRLETDERMSNAYNISLELSEAKLRIEDQSSTIVRLNNLIERLFKNQFSSLDNLSKEYFDKKDSTALRELIVKDFEKEIDHIKASDNMAKIETTVNECCDNILEKIKAQLPKFKDSDIRFLALVIAGFSPKSVCLIMDLTIGNYYNKWTRLRARIAASDAPDKKLFLQIIENK